MVVPPPRIAGNSSLAHLGPLGLLRLICHAEHEDAADAIEDARWVFVGVGSIGEVVHFTSVTSSQPLAETAYPGRHYRRANTCKVKAKPMCLVLKALCRQVARHGLLVLSPGGELVKKGDRHLALAWILVVLRIGRRSRSPFFHKGGTEILILP